MTKKGTKGKEPLKAKDAKKLVEEQMFGMKNKGKSNKLKKLATALEASYTKGKPRQEEQKVTPEVYEVHQKVPVGVDPQTILCVNFKNKVCSQGESCKFSHEPCTEKRIAAILKAKEEADKLSGHSISKTTTKDNKDNKDNKEEKICKFYIDALKSGKHNPKWVCPNGNMCLEKHSPPEGYSLKEDTTEELTIEEYIENERFKLPDVQTPMNEELFNRWKKEREQQKLRESKEQERIKEGNIRLGKIVPSGKDLFVYKPDLFVDDDEALECDYNAREEEIDSEEEEVVQDLQAMKIK
ncbi:hypothetical protein NEHOM01_0470 [Nematocida homosporus]|uniref:uncharacterized protein n=1 Tax=Nematocida homosporus TaxID=1912981 RepID=UPI00221FD67B|nr:uncharacterized protein NEHOM01_0470 [Nematocida homosporus]KAI5184919.1 hypothetical protein NEHOM01_0470 [Nematocida homosporus]